MKYHLTYIPMSPLHINLEELPKILVVPGELNPADQVLCAIAPLGLRGYFRELVRDEAVGDFRASVSWTMIVYHPGEWGEINTYTQLQVQAYYGKGVFG